MYHITFFCSLTGAVVNINLCMGVCVCSLLFSSWRQIIGTVSWVNTAYLKLQAWRSYGSCVSGIRVTGGISLGSTGSAGMCSLSQPWVPFFPTSFRGVSVEPVILYWSPESNRMLGQYFCTCGRRILPFLFCSFRHVFWIIARIKVWPFGMQGGYSLKEWLVRTVWGISVKISPVTLSLVFF